MIVTATAADAAQIQSITARAGVFSEEEVECVREIFEEYLASGAEGSGYHFIVYRDGEKVLGFASYGFRDLTDGVYDLFWIAVDPDARRNGVGKALLDHTENIVRELGGRIMIAETSGTPLYAPTRDFYIRTGYVNEAVIKDFYSQGDDLTIFVKRL